VALAVFAAGGALSFEMLKRRRQDRQRHMTLAPHFFVEFWQSPFVTGMEGERKMSQYMLFLYNDPAGYTKLSPEEMQKAIEKYMAWAKKPFMVGSQRLSGDPGRVIRSNGGKPQAKDGPYSETKEVLGGYYLIEAADYDEAVRRAMDHPHLEYGGTIEVRQLFSM
jgi:hypothetical protein